MPGVVVAVLAPWALKIEQGELAKTTVAGEEEGKEEGGGHDESRAHK
jgi:hypothetical protein